jgi:peroxiredoxin
MAGPGRPARRRQGSPPQAAPRAYPAGLATLRAPVPVPAAPGSAVRAAPGFTLASTGGKAVSLASYRGRVVVLYFSEGVGCDACFYQMREFENHAAELAQAGITVVPIMMNPAAQVRQEMTAFGIRAPYLIDATGAVSRAYGVLGTGMHAGLPGHGFVLGDVQGMSAGTGSTPPCTCPPPGLSPRSRPTFNRGQGYNQGTDPGPGAEA